MLIAVTCYSVSYPYEHFFQNKDKKDIPTLSVLWLLSDHHWDRVVVSCPLTTLKVFLVLLFKQYSITKVKTTFFVWIQNWNLQRDFYHLS